MTSCARRRWSLACRLKQRPSAGDGHDRRAPGPMPRGVPDRSAPGAPGRTRRAQVLQKPYPSIAAPFDK